MARRLSENKFTFTWKIQNFNFCPYPHELRSPYFNMRTSKITSWYISLFVFPECLDFYLNKKGADCYNGNIGYNIEIMDNSEKVLYSTACDKCLFHKSVFHNEQHGKISENLKIVNFRTIKTVRCIIILPEAISDCVYACQAQTKIETEQCSFKWNVKNFSTIEKVSKLFCCLPSAQMKMTLSKCETFASIVIERMECIKNISIVCEIALLDVTGSVIDSRLSEYSFGAESEIWKFPNFIKMSDLFPASGKHLDYNNLSLMCEFWISDGAVLEEVQYFPDGNSTFFEPATTIDSCAKLHVDFRRMYIEQMHTDVTLHTGEEILKAHKCVLSTRSPVFAAMFDKNMLESKTGVVYIPDIESKIVELLLRFMYDGTVANMNYDSAYKLLVAADKYQMLVLMEICSTFLMSNLNNENACDVFILADKISYEVLKDSALNYIVKHIDATEMYWNYIQSNFSLVTEVMRKLSNISSSYESNN